MRLKHFTATTRRSATSCATAPATTTAAFVSPVPPAQSGIADYCGELLPELARYYDIDLIVHQESVEGHGF